MAVRYQLTLVTLPAVTMLASALCAQEPAKDYRSPYTVEFTHPLRELVADIDKAPRGSTQDESSFPHREWYGEKVRRQYGSWGAPARHYPAPRGLENWSTSFKRERAVAVALRFQGYGYQHHHIPDWDPPASWPWKHTAIGHNGKGVDCSNFTAFVYNLGFGIKPSGAVKNQAEHVEIPGPGEGHTTHAETIRKPETYAELVRTLRTGDLVYVRNREGELAHVVLWIGSVGRSPDNAPLIIDSHGDGVTDSNGNHIPCGIHLRPFREGSWYHKSASHAHRIFRGE